MGLLKWAIIKPHYKNYKIHSNLYSFPTFVTSWDNLYILALNHHYSCGLSTATMKYSCPSVCLRVFLSVCVCVLVCAR